MKLKSILSGSRHASKDELSDVRESIAGITKQLQSVYGENLELQEAITELELASEDAGWYKLADQLHRMEFSRDGLDVIVRNSRLYWLNNPLIRRAVDLQCYYVWGQGVSVRSRDGEINEIMQQFLRDPANTSVFSSHAARVALERQLQIEGNLFLAFFTTATTGRVVVRKLPFDEMREIICNPQDTDEVWFYRRRWTDDPSKPEKYVALYPDWRYARELDLRREEKPDSYQGLSVRWESPVMHVAVGALSSMRFGVPETYAALDWARAYKECLEDFKKTVKSLSKWAWSLKTGGGKAAVDAAISKLSSTLGTFHSGETNPAPTGGSTFVASSGVDLQSVDVANAYVDPGGFRVLLRQAGAAMGVPETFFGDASVGTYATASTLDRPTELKFLDRQMLWQDIYSDIAVIVVEAARWATGDILRGGQRSAIEVDFPPILERDVAEQVSAIVRFATMGNWPVQLLNDGPTLLRLGLTALHVDNIEEIVEKFYPADGFEPKGLRPLPTFVPRDKAGNPAVKAAAKTTATSAPQESADALLTQALEDLRRTLYEPEGDGSV